MPNAYPRFMGSMDRVTKARLDSLQAREAMLAGQLDRIRDEITQLEKHPIPPEPKRGPGEPNIVLITKRWTPSPGGVNSYLAVRIGNDQWLLGGESLFRNNVVPRLYTWDGLMERYLLQDVTVTSIWTLGFQELIYSSEEV